MAKKPRVEERIEPTAESGEPFLRESSAGIVIEIGVAYREFVQYLEGNFPAWGELPDETKQLYAESVSYVRAGNEPRTEFERTVKHLLDASPLAKK